MTSQYRQGRVRPATSALAALPLLALLLFAPSPAPAAQAGDLSTCTNQAWAEYNDCLMDASAEWMRTGCDVGFSAEYALCWAKYLGGIKDLFS
jgi:hypothetical protein